MEELVSNCNKRNLQDVADAADEDDGAVYSAECGEPAVSCVRHRSDARKEDERSCRTYKTFAA